MRPGLVTWPKYWPLIGQNSSCDLDTGPWLVNKRMIRLVWNVSKTSALFESPQWVLDVGHKLFLNPDVHYWADIRLIPTQIWMMWPILHLLRSLRLSFILHCSGLWLVTTGQVTWTQASDWLRLLTCPGYWPLIGHRDELSVKMRWILLSPGFFITQCQTAWQIFIDSPLLVFNFPSTIFLFNSY